MDLVDFRSLFTVLAFVSFMGIVWWAWSSRRDGPFTEAARMPLDDDDRPAAPAGAGRNSKD